LAFACREDEHGEGADGRRRAAGPGRAAALRARLSQLVRTPARRHPRRRGTRRFLLPADLDDAGQHRILTAARLAAALTGPAAMAVLYSPPFDPRPCRLSLHA